MNEFLQSRCGAGSFRSDRPTRSFSLRQKRPLGLICLCILVGGGWLLWKLGGIDRALGEPPIDVRLVGAASMGDPASVRLALARGADPNCQPHGFTPLMAAAYSGDLATVRILLDAGADARATGPCGNTALHIAVDINPRAPIVEMLLAAGADPNAPTRSGITPLMTAAENEDASVVRVLMAAGADANASTVNGITPLWAAARAGRAEIACLLLDAGGDIRARDHEGMTARDLAVREDSTCPSQ
jgi:ankyrin repeat protein